MRPRRRAGFALVASLATLIVGGGCGATTSLDIRYPEAGVQPAMLASVAPRRIGINSVIDRRPQPARIGLAPKSEKDIVTRRPVADIVREALAIEVTRNGHAVAGDQEDAVLAAAVEEFRLDIVAGHPTSQGVGRVVIALAVADGRTGATVLARRYTGIRRQQFEKDSARAWREVMDIALTRTMRDLATDPELAAALARLPTGAAPR